MDASYFGKNKGMMVRHMGFLTIGRKLLNMNYIWRYPIELGKQYILLKNGSII